MMSSLMKIKIIDYEHCVSDYGLCILVFIETETFYLKIYSEAFRILVIFLGTFIWNI
jgi:hypothetical protein